MQTPEPRTRPNIFAGHDSEFKRFVQKHGSASVTSFGWYSVYQKLSLLQRGAPPGYPKRHGRRSGCIYLLDPQHLGQAIKHA